MNELLSKISSYNIFNYLFPGAIFAFFGQRAGVIKLDPDDLVTLIIIYYFLGLAISRIGSLVIEPLLKAIKFVQYSDYGDYLRASANDQKMDSMVEANNTYRTLAAMFILLLVAIIGNHVASSAGLSIVTRERMLIVGFLALFLFSFRKQASFIIMRINHHTGPVDKGK